MPEEQSPLNPEPKQAEFMGLEKNSSPARAAPLEFPDLQALLSFLSSEKSLVLVVDGRNLFIYKEVPAGPIAGLNVQASSRLEPSADHVIRFTAVELLEHLLAEKSVVCKVVG